MNGLRLKLRSTLKTATGTFCPRDPLNVREDVAECVNGRVGHRVQPFGHLHADVAGPGFAGLFAALAPPTRPPWRLPERGR